MATELTSPSRTMPTREAGAPSRTAALAEVADAATALISSRQNASPKRLIGPGPDAEQVHRMLSAAAAAPDHGRLSPWRFVHISASKRHRLGDAFASALVERDPSATPAQITAAYEKAHRAPFLMLAVVRLATDRDCAIPDEERLVSLGCAIQNILLTAKALGFGSGLTSGRGIESAPLRELFGLSAAERAICFVNVGTVSSQQPPRMRPTPGQLLSSL